MIGFVANISENNTLYLVKAALKAAMNYFLISTNSSDVSLLLSIIPPWCPHLAKS